MEIIKDSDWEILYKLYETPNMTKVADMLYISQPSLTKRVKNMEKEFGVKIINRTSKGVKFTSEGEYLAKKAKEYMEFIKNVKEGLNSYKTELEGTIKVGSPYTYSKFELTDVLFEYSKKNKNVKFEIINDQSNNLFKMVLKNHIELGFICGDFAGDVNKILVKQNKAYIVSKGPINLEKLSQMQRIDYKTNDKSKEILDRWWRKTYGENPPIGMFAGYVEFAWQLVDKGLGYACCFLPDGFEKVYNLCLTPILDDEGNNIIRNTWLVYPKKKQMSTVVKDFVQFVKDNIQIRE
ncbi:LysR family transcriptional regulator [Intestinibacter bartlettii]|uniref:Transcriptional regulator LysR family n=1 Tax=Intestinibacter bartlettii CAG:1329 TaxID=1263063 RepID=R5X836_9FIRM|nr:LysR family transcriptional regulator [Intestinibacter bartlettii]CDA11818.1 transcriptional regulator LysR family [Intestinibacter bartlettii CAG:1329]